MSEIDWVNFDQLSRAFPEAVSWPLPALIALGHRSKSPLPFVRSSNRSSEPRWDVNDCIRWFRKTYRRKPELVAAFEHALLNPANAVQPATEKRRGKRKAGKP